ncbi:MAG: sensor domain-containing diguanylate cyclase [Chloroflexi bacterium]|nr:sensor domain-containing diguanylate cyclase [Chloroflexota bacterium]
MRQPTSSPLAEVPDRPAATPRAVVEATDDSPHLARRLWLAFGGPLRGLTGRTSRRFTAHGRIATTAPAELVGIQRALLWLRVVGIAAVLPVLSAVSGAQTIPLVAGIAVLALVVGFQLIARRDIQHDRLVGLAIVGAVGDSVAAYLLAQAFVGSAEWPHFAVYPLLAMEAVVVAGSLGALVSTVASIVVLLLQYNERIQLGLASGPGVAVVVVTIFVVSGIFSTTFAGLSRRMRGDLTALLEVSSLLAQQETPTRIVQALDSRLRELVGARIRSFAVRRADGGYDIVRWRTPETRVVSHEAVRRLSAHVGHDIEAEVLSGRAMTILVEAPRDEPVVTALGLPDWVRAITLVPIASDKRLSGILPVLWDSPRSPSTAELDLLNGFAQQTGLAFEQAQLRRARELAATDSLTGLANHRAFRDALDARLSEARRHGSTFSILFCDLDRFKSVNDRHGHAVGDLLLHRVATAIRAAARQEDLVARYGGDEIALLLPETGRFGALDLARRLREAVLVADTSMDIDLTVGVAVHPDDATDPEALIARADAAMYAGKRLGGARIVLASELPAEA